MSVEEKVGRVVLFPLKLVIGLLCFLICTPLLIVFYPFVGIYCFMKAKGPFEQRLRSALCWPLGLLALNGFLSIGGMDNPHLTRLTNWINRKSEKRPKKR